MKASRAFNVSMGGGGGGANNNKNTFFLADFGNEP